MLLASTLSSTSKIAAEALAGADTLIKMVPAGKHVMSLWTELADAVKTGTLLIDCSTIDVESAQGAHALAAGIGCQSLNAPVSGGTFGAVDATLTFMVGSASRVRAPAGFLDADARWPGGSFFVTEAQPVEQTAHIRTVHHHPAFLQRHAQLVQCQLAVFFHSLANEVGMRPELAPAGAVPLPARCKRTRFGSQLHQIVHKSRRNTKMARSLSVAVAFLHKHNNAHTQLDRMRLAHRGSPSAANESPKLLSVNPFGRDAL